MELAVGASPTWDHAAFLAGRQTPGVLWLRRQQLRRDGSAGRMVDLAPSPQPRKSSLLVNRQPVEKTIAGRQRILGRGVQGAGQHGRQPPRPHCLCAHGLGQVHAGHEAQGAAHCQGAAPHLGGHLHEPAARGGGRSLCRRHHRLHHPRRGAAGRHHHRRRQPAVHRAAVLCARAVHDRAAEKPAAHQATAAGPGPVGRRRRHPGVPPRSRRIDAAGRRGPAAV
jgi:hypothetical protein